MANSRIVALDAHMLTPLAPGESSPEHPSWEAIPALGELVVHARTAPADIPARCHGAEVVSLHCPLTDGTRHLVNDTRLALMKPGAFLINTGRGPLVDEATLAAALDRGVLASFGGDVLSAEPPASGNPLLRAPRVVLTPHIAWASIEARHRLMAILAANLRAFLAGKPVNVVG